MVTFGSLVDAALEIGAEPLYWLLILPALKLGVRWGWVGVFLAELCAPFVAHVVNVALAAGRYPDEDFTFTSLELAGALVLGLVVGAVIAGIATAWPRPRWSPPCSTASPATHARAWLSSAWPSAKASRKRSPSATAVSRSRTTWNDVATERMSNRAHQFSARMCSVS